MSRAETTPVSCGFGRRKPRRPAKLGPDTLQLTASGVTSVTISVTQIAIGCDNRVAEVTIRLPTGQFPHTRTCSSSGRATQTQECCRGVVVCVRPGAVMGGASQACEVGPHS